MTSYSNSSDILLSLVSDSRVEYSLLYLIPYTHQKIKNKIKFVDTWYPCTQNLIMFSRNRRKGKFVSHQNSIVFKYNIKKLLFIKAPASLLLKIYFWWYSHHSRLKIPVIFCGFHFSNPIPFPSFFIFSKLKYIVLKLFFLFYYFLPNSIF